MNEAAIRRIQIREAIKAHFDKEQALFDKASRFCPLFFIDEVVKYRVLGGGRERRLRADIRRGIPPAPERGAGPGRNAVRKYLKGMTPEKTHNGYFSIDKKTKRLVNPASLPEGKMQVRPMMSMPMT